MSLQAWRSKLAADVAGVTGLAAWSYPPPSLVPPAVVVLIGPNYVTGPPRTGCLVDTQVIVRLVTDVHEQSGAFDDLDALIERALGVLPGFLLVNVGARTYGDSRYWCADITVAGTTAVDLSPAPAPPRAPAPTTKEG